MRRIVLCLMMGLCMLAACESDPEGNGQETVEPDPKEKFQIYLCFGQSNMEGAGTIEAQDKVEEDIDERFQVLAAANTGTNARNRQRGQWDHAVPPLCNNSGLGPIDYFGRTLLADNTDPDARVGVIVVAVGAAPINLFFKDEQSVKDYLAGLQSGDEIATRTKARYDDYPYGRMVEMAKKAQEIGVIKGILLHQGEAGFIDANGIQHYGGGAGDKEAWSKAVKGIYDDLLKDLGLEANSVPLLAGEVVEKNTSMNTMVNYLDNVMPAYIISSKDLTIKDDYHFDSAGYRELGRRYAAKMLELLAE